MIFEPNRNELEQVNNIRDVIVEWKSRCNKVCFDISIIRNTKKIYDVYRIHRDEKIIAFCKGNLPLIPLSMDGVVFTDAAVYFFGKDGTEKIQHIEYIMLPRYLVAHDGEKGRVYAISDQFEREIYRGTVFSQNVAGIEIVRILISIQQELCATNPKAKAERDIVIQGMLQQATEELQTGILSKRINAVLGGLMLQPECCNQAASLKAEYIFRECDQEKYSEFVKSLYGRVSEYTYNELERIPQEYFERFIHDITDMNSKFGNDILEKMYNTLRRAQQSDNRYQVIQAYLSVRLDNTTSYKEVASVRDMCGDAEANRIEWFRGISGYRKMYTIYQCISHNEELTGAYLAYRDGLGLTSLHYALLLKNEAVVTKLLQKTPWIQPAPIIGTPELDAIYDYVLLAYGKQVSCRVDVLQRAHPGVYEIRKRYENIKGKIQATKLKLEVQKTNYSAGKRRLENMRYSNTDTDQMYVLEGKLDDLKGYIEDSVDTIRTLEGEMRETEVLICEMSEKAVDNALHTLSAMWETGDSFSKYLYRIFFEPGFFEQVLHASREQQNMCMYEYRGFYFVAPRFAQIDLPIVEIKVKDSDNDQCQMDDFLDYPKYGSSWFSPEAHRNETILKSEYRKLTKEFHPDVSKHLNCNWLFQEITVEYSEVLKQIVG